MCVVIAFRIPRFRRRLMGNDLARGCSTDGDTNTTRMCCCFGSDWTKSSALCVSPGFNHTTKQTGLVVKHVLRQNPFQRLGRDLAISKRFFLLLTSETHEIRYSGNPRHISLREQPCLSVIHSHNNNEGRRGTPLLFRPRTNGTCREDTSLLLHWTACSPDTLSKAGGDAAPSAVVGFASDSSSFSCSFSSRCGRCRPPTSALTQRRTWAC